MSITIDRTSGAAFVAGSTGGAMYNQAAHGTGSDLFLLKLL
jgi:hypothetical protein